MVMVMMIKETCRKDLESRDNCNDDGGDEDGDQGEGVSEQREA